MDPKEIRELIELISRSNFVRFELSGEDFKLKLVKAEPPPAAPLVAAVAAARTAEAAAAPPTSPLVEAAAAATAAAPAAPAAAEDGFVALNSPIVGTFYSASGPDSEPFVRPGSQVKKGQVVCIVEAMKVMNEIESEIDGEVVEIVVANEQPVEYGEVLMRLRPTS